MRVTNYYMDRSGDDIWSKSTLTENVLERFTWIDSKYDGLYECFYENGDPMVVKQFDKGKVISTIEYWPGKIIRLCK